MDDSNVKGEVRDEVCFAVLGEVRGAVWDELRELE
jgi:hypothetical protein